MFTRRSRPIRPLRALFAVVAVTGVALVATAAGAGCATSSDNAGPPPTAAQCPATVAEAIGAACGREGEDCGIGYACGNVPEQAHCVCTSGKYVCTDATNASVGKGAQPACVPPGQANDKECPGSESGTESKSCKTAGLLCSYLGVLCPESATPNLDTCQCVGSATGGLAFHCEPKLCLPSSDASDDAFTVPDTSKDAPADG